MQLNVIQMGNFQPFWPGVVKIRALHHTKDDLVPQYDLSNPGVSVVRLSTHFCQNFRAQHVFHNVQNSDCNELHVVLPLKCDGVRSRLHPFHKRVVTAHTSDSFICKLAQHDPFSLRDFQPVSLNNKTDQDVFLKPSYVTLEQLLPHWLQTMKFV